jgi:GDP-L-fucose synthase
LPIFELQGRRVCVAGHRGMVGSALVRRLEIEDYRLLTPGREELVLRNRAVRLAPPNSWISAAS